MEGKQQDIEEILRKLKAQFEVFTDNLILKHKEEFEAQKQNFQEEIQRLKEAI